MQRVKTDGAMTGLLVGPADPKATHICKTIEDQLIGCELKHL